VVTLNNLTLAYTGRSLGTLVTTDIAAGDVLEVSIESAVAGGGAVPKGVFFELTLNELPQ
jgi:hypothetical protein